MVPEDVAKAIIDAFATSPRTVINLPECTILHVQVAGVMHVLYEYGWDHGYASGSAFAAEYVPGLYCETPNGQLSRNRGYVAINVERVAPDTTPVTCLFCVYEGYRLTRLST